MIPPTFDDCRTAKYIEAVGTNDLAREPEELCWSAVAITPPPLRNEPCVERGRAGGSAHDRRRGSSFVQCSFIMPNSWPS